MGYHRHHAILVTGCDDAALMAAHAYASDLFLPPSSHYQEPLCWVSPISPNAINGYRSFFVAPDGSKEGWDPSYDADDRRRKFTDWLVTRAQHGMYLDWAEVAFYDEGGRPEIERASCTEPTEEV